MKLVNHGKTKDVFVLDNGNYLLKFKDDVTGVDGVFDPGANQVGLTIEGIGHLGLKMTQFFFEELEKRGINTHMVNIDLDNNTMEVKKATLFGKGLEIICRFRAVGSFYKRYNQYIEEGTVLSQPYVEVTIKYDDGEDPIITKEGLLELGIFEEGDYEILVEETKKICVEMKNILKEKGLDLYDIKLEFGKVGADNVITLIDEISGGNMRVYKDGTYIPPLELEQYIF